MGDIVKLNAVGDLPRNRKQAYITSRKNDDDALLGVMSMCKLSMGKGDDPLVCRRKLFSSYRFFASSLVSLKPSISHLQAFGTDGEENLKCIFCSFPMLNISDAFCTSEITAAGECSK